MSPVEDAGSEVLLGARPLFRASSREETEAELRRAYKVQRVAFGPTERPFFAVANRAQLSGVVLHYCRYDAPTEIEFSNADGFRQFFCLSGKGSVRVNGHAFDVGAGSTGIVSPGSDFVASYGEGYSHLVIQVGRQMLMSEFERVQGREAPTELSLPTEQTLDCFKLQRLRSIALALAGQFSEGADANAVTVSQLEQALVSSFLFENQSNFSHLLRRQPLAAGGREVSLFEDYVHANWDKPLTVEAIASACGVSVRSVFLRFQQKRGVSPMTYLRDLRLEHARRQLLDGECEGSVIDVAMRCGFSSFGHFARRYREKFGELPSATLAKRLRPPKGVSG